MGEQVPVFEVHLDSGRKAKLRELPAIEFEGLYKRTSSAGQDQGWELTHHGLRLCLVELDGQRLTPQDLIGKGLSEKVACTRTMMLLRQAWEQIHLPNAEEQAGVRAMTAIEG